MDQKIPLKPLSHKLGLVLQAVLKVFVILLVNAVLQTERHTQEHQENHHREGWMQQSPGYQGER
jgi:hypothetical protein